MAQIQGIGKLASRFAGTHTITALSSGPNDKFNAFIDRYNDDMEEINKAAHAKYLNMDSTKSWDKLDPRNAKLLSLTAELEHLKRIGTAKTLVCLLEKANLVLLLTLCPKLLVA